MKRKIWIRTIIFIIIIIGLFLLSEIIFPDKSEKFSTEEVNVIVVEKIYEETETLTNTKKKYKLKFKEENSEKKFIMDCKYSLYSRIKINDSMKINKRIVYSKYNERVYYDFLE